MKLDELKQSILPREEVAPEPPPPGRRSVGKLVPLGNNGHGRTRAQTILRARAMAHDYLTSGGKLTNEQVRVLRISTDALVAFNNELLKSLDRAGIGKERILAILWKQATYSILDFIDDDGVTMSIKDLRALPRDLQAMIERIETVTVETVIKDKDGNPLLDENGVPRTVKTQTSTVKLPDKIEAMKLLAGIMRWVGPLVNIESNTTINIAQIMQSADQRKTRTAQLYEGEKPDE